MTDSKFSVRDGWLRPIATLAFVIVLAAIFSPRHDGFPIFWRPENLANILRQISVIGILSMGMTLVIISGGIDLSVGSLLALSCTIFAYVLTQYTGAAGAYVAILLAIAATAVFGYLSGLVVTRLRLQPFIVTLATMIGARGMAKWLVGNATIAVGYDEHTAPIVNWIGQRTVVVSVFAAVSLVYLVILNLTRFGRHLVAVGGSEETARLSGINVDSVKVRVYLLSGIMAGIAGILYCCETRQGDPKAGTAYELDAIAAVVIGGTRLMGGHGTVIGTMVGVLVLGVISNILGLNNVDENVQWMLKAVIIIAAVWLQRAGRKT